MAKWCRVHFQMLLLLAGTAASGATHATITFEYQSTCAAECVRIGASIGDPVGGLIGFSNSSVSAGVFTVADIDSFDVTFGTFHFLLSSLGSAIGGFNAARDAALPFSFAASGIGAGYSFNQASWIAGASPAFPAAGGAGTLTLAAVPEPSTYALMLAGLGCLAIVANRRRKAPPAAA